MTVGLKDKQYAITTFWNIKVAGSVYARVWIQREGGGGGGGDRGSGPRPLKNHKNIGSLNNTGPDPQKNHKATKPEFNVGQSSARQGISLAGR